MNFVSFGLFSSWVVFTSAENVAFKEPFNKGDNCASSAQGGSSYLLTAESIVCYITDSVQRSSAVEETNMVTISKTISSAQRIIRCGKRKEDAETIPHNRILFISKSGKSNTDLNLYTGETRPYVDLNVDSRGLINAVHYIPSRNIVLVAKNNYILSFKLFGSDGKLWKRQKYIFHIAHDDIHKFVFAFRTTWMFRVSYNGRALGKSCIVSSHYLHSISLDETNKVIYMSTINEIFRTSYDCNKMSIVLKTGTVMTLDVQNDILYYENKSSLNGLNLDTRSFVLNVSFIEEHRSRLLFTSGGQLYIIRHNLLKRVDQNGTFSKLARTPNDGNFCLIP